MAPRRGVDAAEIEGWRAQTSAGFRSEWLPGGHFFLREHGAALRALVQTELRGAAAPAVRAAHAEL